MESGNFYQTNKLSGEYKNGMAAMKLIFLLYKNAMNKELSVAMYSIVECFMENYRDANENHLICS